jgi:hypothetical protein
MAWLPAEPIEPRPETLQFPERCPRCGADFEEECNLREVNLTLTSGEREWDEDGLECARCGWCTEVFQGTTQ